MNSDYENNSIPDFPLENSRFTNSPISDQFRSPLSRVNRIDVYLKESYIVAFIWNDTLTKPFNALESSRRKQRYRHIVYSITIKNSSTIQLSPEFYNMHITNSSTKVGKQLRWDILSEPLTPLRNNFINSINELQPSPEIDQGYV